MPKLMRSTAELWRAIINSWQGLKIAWQGEIAFRQYLVIALVLIPLALVLGDNAAERGLMILSVFLVLIVELLNTAIEAAIDRISTEQHKLSAAAKDLGSAAVFLSVILFFIIWLMVLLT